MKEEITAALKHYPVFSVKNIAGVLDKDMNYSYLAAYRLKKSGTIHEIEKGKYSMEEDPFIVASWIVWPSYISGYAALNYHKLTEQLPFTIQVMTTRKRKRKTISYANAKIEFVKTGKKTFFGFRRINYQGKEIFIAEKERAIIDALASRKMSLGEAEDIIKNNKRKISKKKLFFYAKSAKEIYKKLKEILA